MMQRIKFHPLLVFWIGILLLALACRGNAPGAATPTAPVVSPTPVQSEPSPTPMPAPKTDAGAIGLGDSLYPYFGNGGYDVQHYSLDLTIHDVVTSELSGITRIEAKATQDLSSFNLDFIGFEISTIIVNGQPADYKRFRQELTITPVTSLPANEPFTVEIHYEGSPATFRSVALSIQMGWVRYSGGSYVMSEPDGAASFFPANDHPLDKALYTIRVTVPKPFEVAANGTLTETTDNGATTTFLFEMRDPMASYLTTVNIGEFDLETSRSENGVTIRNYFAAGVPEEARQVFDSQGEMLAHFSDLFGPYPFDEYGALVLDTEIGGALETQTMSLFGIQDPVNGERLESVIAHELAHQWFGDSISLADWRDIWLNESFATYSQGLWIEHTDGRDALDDWIRELYRFLLENQQYVRPPGQPVADDLFNVGVYYWGAVGLHALRLEVGDEQFFEILRTYYERFENTNVTTADFIPVAEEVSGKDLDSFFNIWLYSKTLAPIPSLGLEPKP